MKKNITVCIFALLISALLCSVGCETKPELTYTEENFRFTEEYGSNWVMNGTHYITLYNEHKYVFDKNIGEDERLDFVISEEKLCDYLNNYNISTADFTFFVLDDYVCRSDSETKTAFLSVSSMNTSEQIKATLFSVLGDYTNYGYVYALSEKIAGHLEWQKDSFDFVSDYSEIERSPLLTTLVYPCFSDKYSSTEKINSCKKLSIELLSQMGDPFWGEDLFTALAERFAEENGIPYQDTHLRFAFGGTDCIMKIRTRYMEIFCSSKYEKSEERLLPEYDPMYSYETMIPFLTQLDDSIDPLRELFGVTNEKLVPVNLTGSIKSDNTGLFWPKEDDSYIDTESLFVLKHEYIHYLDYRSFIDNGGLTKDWSYWTHEVLTTYYSVDQSYLSRKALIDSGAVDDPSDFIKNEYDSGEDELLFLRLMLSELYEKSELPYYLKTQYTIGASSFGWYFTELYGDEALVLCMIYPERTKEVTGRTLDEIVDGWCDWILGTKRP